MRVIPLTSVLSHMGRGCRSVELLSLFLKCQRTEFGLAHIEQKSGSYIFILIIKTVTATISRTARLAKLMNTLSSSLYRSGGTLDICL